MAYLYVSQYDMSGLSSGDQFIEKVPALSDDKRYLPDDGSEIAFVGPIGADTVVIRFVCDLPVNVSFGPNATANQEDMLLPANTVARARVTPGHYISAVVNQDATAPPPAPPAPAPTPEPEARKKR